MIFENLERQTQTFRLVFPGRKHGSFYGTSHTVRQFVYMNLVHYMGEPDKRKIFRLLGDHIL